MAKNIPTRMCIGCGCMDSKNNMMRVIKTSENEILLDVTGRKNGRGAYLCKKSECLLKARKNKGLEKSFKMAISKSIYDSLEKEFLIGTAE